VRLFVVNAGPNFESDFHIVGAIFDRVYPDGNPAHALEDVQTYHVPAGGGAVFETVFSKDASGEGLYPFVTHSFADAEKGAVGIIEVGSQRTPTWITRCNRNPNRDRQSQGGSLVFIRTRNSTGSPTSTAVTPSTSATIRRGKSGHGSPPKQDERASSGES
jgi:hypothetical protein